MVNSRMAGYDKIIIWGVGRALAKHSFYFENVDYFVDSKVKNDECVMSEWGIPIYSPDILHKEKGRVLIAVSAGGYLHEIFAQAKKIIPQADVIYASEFFVHKAAHFGQFGEDAVIESFLRLRNLTKISYLEIGIPYPIDISNTYHFYLNGHSGVCVEANPEKKDDLERVRPRDTVICCGCAAKQDEGKNLKFYIVENHPGLNTFSRDKMLLLEKKGFKCERMIEVPMISLNSILLNYCKEVPTFVSIDIEGMEYAVLKDLDFEKWSSDCFCIEKGDPRVKELMISKGYAVYAETPPNWIFVLGKYMKEFFG